MEESGEVELPLSVVLPAAEESVELLSPEAPVAVEFDPAGLGAPVVFGPPALVLAVPVATAFTVTALLVVDPAGTLNIGWATIAKNKSAIRKSAVVFRILC